MAFMKCCPADDYCEIVLEVGGGHGGARPGGGEHLLQELEVRAGVGQPPLEDRVQGAAGGGDDHHD